MQLAYGWQGRAAAGIAETNRAAGTAVSVGAGPGLPAAAVVVAWPAFAAVACAAVESFADIERSVEVGCHEGMVALVRPYPPLLRLEPVKSCKNGVYWRVYFHLQLQYIQTSQTHTKLYICIIV